MGGVNGYLEWVGNPSWGRVPGEEGRGVVFGGRLGLLLVSAVAVPWCREECGVGGVWCGEEGGVGVGGGLLWVVVGRRGWVVQILRGLRHGGTHRGEFGLGRLWVRRG